MGSGFWMRATLFSNGFVSKTAETLKLSLWQTGSFLLPMELGALRLMQSEYNASARTHRQAASAAQELNSDEIAFQAQIGVARAESSNRNHGAAAAAVAAAAKMVLVLH